MSCGPSNPQPVDPVVEDEFTEPEMEAPISFDLDSIKNRGVLRAIVVSGPTSFFIYKGETMGYEYEMLTRFADHLGVKLEIVVASSFSELGELLNSGEGDVIAHGLTVTQNRQKYFAFSDYLYLTHQGLVQSKPDNERPLGVRNCIMPNPNKPMRQAKVQGTGINYRTGKCVVTLASVSEEPRQRQALMDRHFNIMGNLPPDGCCGLQRACFLSSPLVPTYLARQGIASPGWLPKGGKAATKQ
jgi:ABC-type amino acid transport substrate-binding protein